MTAPRLLLRSLEPRDVPALLSLINGYAARGLLLPRSEASLRERLGDFTVAELGGRVVGCAALSGLGPGLAEVRSLAVAPEAGGAGLGHAIVEHLLAEAGVRGFREVLALTRRQSFFARLGFVATERERFADKLRVDCAACPKNLCCDEVAMVRRPSLSPAASAGSFAVDAPKEERASVEHRLRSREALVERPAVGALEEAQA